MSAGSPAKVLFGAPIIGSSTEDRVLVEHEDGGWSVGRVSRSGHGSFTREVSFRLEDIIDAAMKGFEGSPEIQTVLDRQAGKGLAAGVLLLVVASGLLKVGPDGSETVR